MHKKRFGIILAAFIAFLSSNLMVGATRLPRCTPESMGVPSQRIAEVVDSFLSYTPTELHSFMALRHGNVIAECYPEPYSASSGQQLFSCSKTFVAAAIGLAIENNLLRLDDRLCAFFPEFLPDTVSPELAAITVRHLLTMNSGLPVDTSMRTRCDDWIRTYLAQPLATEPGTRFAYDSIDTYLLAAIVQRVTGMTLLDYLQELVFDPLDIHDASWEISPEGINTGGWGMYATPESLARFGQLLLQKGRWEDSQVLPEKWVEEMMKHQVDHSWGGGYGYQMWMCTPEGSARADGAYGQLVIVEPGSDMVFVITQCNTGDSGYQQTWLWNRLLPYLSDSPLPEPKNPPKFDNKSLPLLQGKSSSHKASALFGKIFNLEDNPYGWKSLTITAENKAPTLHINTVSGTLTDIPLAYKGWSEAPIAYLPPNAIGTTHGSFDGIKADFTVAANYAWTSPDTLAVKLHYNNWGTSTLLRFKVGPDGVLTLTASDSFAPKKAYELQLIQ